MLHINNINNNRSSSTMLPINNINNNKSSSTMLHINNINNNKFNNVNQQLYNIDASQNYSLINSLNIMETWQHDNNIDNSTSTTYATTTSSTWQLNINDICNNNFINLTTYMHVVPIRASSPQHKSINTLTGHQALNVKSKSSQGIKSPT